MRTKNLAMLIVIFMFSCFGQQALYGQTYKLTFQVDMSEAGVEDPATVGIRGDIAPLSWTETYPMKGPDKNGVYTATIEFEGVEYGERLQYKFYHGDNNWDNDRYGEFGNRITPLCCKKQKLPLDTWDEQKEYSFENMYESSAWDGFMSWIYIVGSAKKRGISMQDLAQENVDFWDWPVEKDVELEMFLNHDSFQQAKNPYGYFEEIDNSPDRIEYILGKPWEDMINLWSEDGIVQGVTADDINAFFKEMTRIYVELMDAELEWIEEADNRVRIIITR